MCVCMGVLMHGCEDCGCVHGLLLLLRTVCIIECMNACWDAWVNE